MPYRALAFEPTGARGQQGKTKQECATANAATIVPALWLLLPVTGGLNLPGVRRLFEG